MCGSRVSCHSQITAVCFCLAQQAVMLYRLRQYRMCTKNTCTLSGRAVCLCVFVCVCVCTLE